MKLSNILNGTSSLTVELNGEKLKVKYKTNLMSDEMQEKVRSILDEDEALRNIVADTIVEWDMSDDDGIPVECSADILKLIDTRVVAGLWQAMVEDSRPNLKTGNISTAA